MTNQFNGLIGPMIEGVNTLGIQMYQRETRQCTIQYQKDLEQALSIHKKQLQALQKDHDILNQSYIFELNRNSKIEHASTVVKRALNKLIGGTGDQDASLQDKNTLCQNCH